ncbi:MAG: T9SS type A sorting domain-containing protein [Salinivirgaceae bacterium]|nr:T9SS type A sorting domain-containing protein [Salinivirgaceae bacterium]
MKKLFTAAFLVCTLGVFGQSKASDDNIIFYEGFESNSSSLPNGWTGEYKQEDSPKPNSLRWKLNSGGAIPTGSDVAKPETAHGGNKNAYLYYLSVLYKHKMYLVSPPIDFKNYNVAGAKKPMLVFWYSQFQDRASFGDDSGVDNFEFSLHYRVDGGAWKSFGTPYTQPTDDSEPWKCDSVMLPSEVCSSNNVQIAFLGVTKTVGHGCCIDDVSIIETDVIPRKVESITATHPSTNVMPTNSTDNSILRLRIKVSGNDGTIKLNSLAVTAMNNQTIAAVEENGMKLFYTATEFFNSDTPLDTTSIVNGKATFSGLDMSLPTGSSYLWITCDIKEDHEHRFRNNIVDFKVDPNDINVSGLTYPTTALSPNGNRIIAESIFIDNFEDQANSEAIWTFDGEFERAAAKQPNGPFGGTGGGNPNPSNAHGGAYMIGTDITGLGSLKGNYEKNIGSDAYFAESKSFNCYYYKDISLMFYRWLNVSNSDTAAVKISFDGGTTWSNIWASSSVIQEKDWSFQYLNLNKVADRNPNVKLRFTLGPTRSGLAYSGWNIDDVALVGTYIYKDAALTEILTPNTACGLGTNEAITIRLKNVGFNDINAQTNSEDSVLVSYSIDGGAWVTDTVKENIKRDAELLYTFKTKADLSKFGSHDIVVKVSLGTDVNGNVIDEDERNDFAQKTIMTLPYRDVPYAQTFDSIGDYWFGRGDTWQYARLSEKDVENLLRYRSSGTWQYGKPSYAGSPCWYTKVADTTYAAHDSSWLETPCFNMKAMQKPIIEFRLRGSSASTDGLAVYYSVDNGGEWKILPAYSSALPHPSWNWYNNASVAALKTAGWSGKFGWQIVKQLLPDEVAGQDSVKFRFVFASGKNSGFKGEGFAIDDFRMYESPVDAGIAGIIEPVDACELLEEQPITVAIQNFGLRGIIPTDSIIASVVINDKLTLTDTLFVTDTLAVGGIINHTFNQKVNMWYKKAYKMTAYTQVVGDTMRLFQNGSPLVSGVNNDTAQAVANVLGEPQYDLGADIGTLDPSATQLDGRTLSDGITPFDEYRWKYKYELPNGEIAVVPEDCYFDESKRKLKKLIDFPAVDGEYEYYIYDSVRVGQCWSTDSVKIIKSKTDVGIIADNENLNLPSEFCINTDFNNITVKVKNMSGVDEGEVPAGQTISICYRMFDADSNLYTYSEDTILEGGFAKQATFLYKFKQQPKFEVDGEQKIWFFTQIRADIDHSNDTLAPVTVTVWPLPTVDLGVDSILIADPRAMVLSTEAIAGATYSWLNYQDTVQKSDKNSFAITDSLSAKYKVAVTDVHKCATVVDSVLVVTDDWTFAGMLSPTNQCEPQSGMDITVSLVNNSLNEYGAGYRIPAVVNVNGATQRDTIVLTDSVFAHDTISYKLMKSKADFPAIGQFPVSVKIMPPHDIDRDDTSNVAFEYVNIWGIPRLELGIDTIFTLQPDTVVLDAGQEFSWFKWNKRNEYMSQTYNVLTTDNTCYVFAMNDHGCYAEDQKIYIYDDYLGDTIVATDTVIIITTDVEFDEIISPVSSCDITEANVLTIDIRNNGLSAIKNGTELPVKVQINDEAAKTVTFKLKEQLKVGATTQLSMPFVTNFESDKNYVVKTWLDWNLDRFHDNDTSTITVSQFPHPNAFSLGDDVYTTQPDTIVLHAPEKQYYYAWSNGLRGDTVDAIALPNAASTSYSVRVFNEYNCITADTMSVYTYDLEFSAFTDKKKENSNSCEPIEDAVVHGKISVKSLDEIPVGTNMTANFDFNGKSDKFEITLPTPINKDKPYTFDFKEKISVPDTGNYVMTSGLTVNNMREADTANFKSTEFRVGTYQLPFEDTVSTRENVYTIDAGNLFSIFDWYTEQHHDGQTLTVVKSGDYRLKATDINGCETEDSTYVLFIKPRYEIAKIEFDTLLCENAEPSKISFYLKNTGNDIIASGSQTEISYMTNDSVLNKETFTFNKTIREKDSILISFNKLANFAKVDVDSVRIKAVIAGFETMKTVAVTTKPNPMVSLGDDFATTNTDTILSVGDGFANYLWSTGETAAGISIGKDGNYWVKVHDEFGCANSDTVHAHFIPATIAISKMTSPVSACGSITDQPIVFELINNSKTVVKKGQKIGVTCIIDNVQELRYTTTLVESFDPSAVYTDTIGSGLNISEVGVHSLKFITDVDGVANDTAEYEVEVYGLPELSFAADTLKTEAYPYILKANTTASGLTYMWSTNETTDSISIGSDSKYFLKVTDGHGCSAMDSVVVRKIEKVVPIDTPEVNPGINKNLIANVAIYPNPTDNILNVDFGGFGNGERRILIANATGQIIFASKQTSDIMQINVIDWIDGMYFVKIEGDGGSRILKFVKQ